MARGKKVQRVKKISGQRRLKGISGKVKPSAQDLMIAKNVIVGKMKKGRALEAAGISPAAARSNSADIFRRPGVQAAMSMVMEEAGITPQVIAQKLNEGLNATKVISANMLMLGEQKPDEIIDGTAIAGAEREKVFIRVEDFPVRHKYLETSCKLMDLFPHDKPQGAGIDPEVEQNMIMQAEQEAGKRDVSRYLNREQ